VLKIRESQLRAMAEASPGTQIINPCQDEATWIEIRLVDTDDIPISGERYQIRLPDGSLMPGVLNGEGTVRFDSIVAGQAVVSFPDLDAREWEAK
jgi:hypothetical protein